MISDPSLVHYACVAIGSVVLAEFNSKDAELGAMAIRCLEKTPQFHSLFSHTVRQRTYTFLISDPFVYFVIFDDKLERSDALLFLRGVKNEFNFIIQGSSAKKRLENAASHCFQGEFNPVFHQLLSSMSEMEEAKIGDDRSCSFDSKAGSTPLFSEAASNLKKKKKKMRIFGEFRKGENEDRHRKLDHTADDVSVAVHKNSNGAFSGELGHQRAKKVWKKQVWVVLSLDLIVCTILFAIWLWVCRGFKCIDG